MLGPERGVAQRLGAAGGQVANHGRPVGGVADRHEVALAVAPVHEEEGHTDPAEGLLQLRSDRRGNHSLDSSQGHSLRTRSRRTWATGGETGDDVPGAAHHTKRTAIWPR